MADLTMVDSAYPQAGLPATDAILVYGPGDAIHTWTPAEVAAPSARYRLPVFVRSNPAGASYVQDCNAFVAWLKAVGAPKGIRVGLDLEESVSVGYVSAFGYIMHMEGFSVSPYGALAYVWQNPHLDGLYTAHYTGTSHRCTPGACGNGLNTLACMTQWLTTPGYDLSLIDPSVPLWDTDPPQPAPSPPTNLLEENVTSYYVNNQHHVYAQRTDGSVDHWWQDTSKPASGWSHETLPKPA